MNVALNIILFVCFYPIVLITTFVLKNEVVSKKNIILGVTLPHTASQDEEVISLINAFKQRLNMTTLAMSASIIPVFFIKYQSIIFAYYMFWMTLAIIVPPTFFVIYHKKVKALKNANNWTSAFAGKTIVDIEVAAEPKKMLSVWRFLPAVAISLIPVVHTLVVNMHKPETAMLLITYSTFAVIVAVIYPIYRTVYRGKSEVIDDNAQNNLELTQMRRYYWGQFWLWFAWLTSAFTIFFWFFITNVLGILVVTALYSTALLFVMMRAELSTRNLQHKLSQETKTPYSDDDENWINGVFYYNPNDKHLMVNQRVGLGTTINLAKTPGKILMGFSLLCILSAPFLGIWVVAEEFTPIKIQVSDTKIAGYHTGKAYELDLSDIESVELIEKLPPLSRVAGSSFSNMLKGKYNVSKLGTCSLLLNPKSPPFIVLKTAKKTYIFGTYSKDETMDLFTFLKS